MLAAWAATGLLALVGLVVLRAWAPSGISACLLYNLTGVSCPGCGMTRACALLAQGRLAESLRMHPLAPLFAVEAAIAWTWWGLVALRRARVPSPWWGICVLAFDVAALFATWIVRLELHALPT